MSHFTVLVIGEDADGQLAPYDENSEGTLDAKWDWYQVGGRWSGYFILKPGAEGVRGEPGVFGSGSENGGVDIAHKGDIDFDAMRDAAAKRAGEEYDEIKQIVGSRVWRSWETVRAQHPEIDEARTEYWTQPVLVDLRKQFAFIDPDQYLCTRDEYVERARSAAVPTFAVIKDGQWYESGEMGWWGIVRNEKDAGDWNAEFNKLVADLPDDTLLTIVDCHI